MAKVVYTRCSCQIEHDAIKKNGFTIFLYPLENISDVMEDTVRVLLLVCFMSLSPEVIF